MNHLSGPLRLTLRGLTSLCLLTLLASCVTVPMPPASLLAPTPITEPCATRPASEAGKPCALTNGDVAKLAVDRAFDTEKANLDKKAVRAWYDGYCAALGWRCRLRKD